MLMPTYEKWYLCTVCHELISNLELEKHILTHSGEKPYQCIYCGKPFPMTNHLKSHMGTHIGEKQYQCNVFNMSFSCNTKQKSS